MKFSDKVYSDILKRKGLKRLVLKIFFKFFKFFLKEYDNYVGNIEFNEEENEQTNQNRIDMLESKVDVLEVMLKDGIPLLKKELEEK